MDQLGIYSYQAMANVSSRHFYQGHFTESRYFANLSKDYFSGPDIEFIRIALI